MTAAVEPLPSGERGLVALVAGIPVREGVLEIQEPVKLHHGGELPSLRLAWRLTGPAGAPVVCALGGISAHRRVCLTEDVRDSWWPRIAGPGLPLDASRFRILSFDFVGGSSDSTGPGSPEAGPGEFPVVSSYDQAAALNRLLDSLRIPALRAFCGSSYGGMVALAFAQMHPDRVSQLLIIGASDRANPMASAWRSTQREIVRFGIDTGRPEFGMDLARRLAMTTYRSPEEFSARFDGPAKVVEGRYVLPVEEYLAARGRDYAASRRPEAFLRLSESIDLHRVDVSRIFVPVTAVAVSEDRLVPLADIRAMVARLPDGRLYETSSVFGHDAFLKEADQLRPVFATVLGSAS